MILYRPVGVRELELIAETGYRRFPPRLPHQPIFYPVLHREYAVGIARDWNTKDEASGYAGFVTEFEVDDAFAPRYTPHVVGRAYHSELWVPAEELAPLNDQIQGYIRILEAFAGPGFQGTM